MKTGRFYLYHSLCMLSVIIKSGAKCTSVHLYTTITLQMVQQYICVQVYYWYTKVNIPV